ncbi:glycoside hydrolase family 88 protein [Paenibacillus glycanilyticus]|uniref:glycoside hydrolase family 88/105 protein n=1 Tax=Paenibacillus glycanilyticus TaxID=126569 RepID=UPI00203EF065|nr:glycoside hydrolase family 88 protein [Paenibacillus glycanilyticus]MCM3626841.1 glycoside hydrolase family 88 protein [Paenibacillus glycanilyticus]
MTVYIEPRDSARYAFGDEERRILELLASRYVGANPPVPFAYRAFSHQGILQDEEGLYNMELGSRWPQAANGDYAYVYGLVWSDNERSIDCNLEPIGPIRLYMNDKRLFRTSAVEEMKPDARVVIPMLLAKGWNRILIEARRTPAGFGCRFGADEAKVRILNVLAPFASRDGSAGWVFSEPVKKSCFGEGNFPNERQPEEETGISWLPRTKWLEAEEKQPNLERQYGTPAATVAGYGWTRLPVSKAESLVLEGRAFGPASVWLDGKLVLELAEAGAFRESLKPAYSSGHLLIRTESSARGWGFEFHASADGKPLALIQPVHIHGYDGKWLYAGPIAANKELDASGVCGLTALLPAVDLSGRPAASTYWELDMPQTRLRPYYENAMLSNKWTVGTATNFGRWDYPLGVTMYGLLRAARELNRGDWSDYALSHIRTCTDMYDYSLWDRQEYGFPSVNQQLVLTRMLDNCGSFGSAMLEAYLQEGGGIFRRIAEPIADFMLKRLERREDGAFFRLSEGEYFDNTLWADDLYMSAPFLTRYAVISGNREVMDEAARQFLLFRSYLFIEEERVMSHVYDFKYGQATRVPWGRGNGWVLFSLTELLERLPEDHPDRAALLDFFRTMCLGVADLQSSSGLWRQVLNEPEAYEEASCTAMFTYAFARGIRFGWLSDDRDYAAAARKAWRGLTENAIDRAGNVHGVCSGSRYSFSPDYYMHDLRTVVNDNHGIGIMLLAGVEISMLNGAG